MNSLRRPRPVWRVQAALAALLALVTAPALPATLGLLLAPASPAHAQNPFLEREGGRHIQRIEFFGNRRTREYVLRRELGFVEGDAYNAEAIALAWERLEKLDFIAYVDIQEKTEGNNDVVLVIQVEEDTPLLLAPALAYDRRHDGYYAGGHVRYRNFRGRAEELALDTAWGLGKGILHAYRLGWSNPWVLGGARLGVGVDGVWQRYDFRYYPFDYQEAAGRLRVWRELGPFLRATGSFAYRSIQIDDSDDPASFPDNGVVEPTLGLDVEFDSRDLRFYPSRGVHLLAESRFAALGRDHHYNTYRGHLAGFYPVPILGILAGRVEYRVASTLVPVYEQEFLGGPESLRGIDFGTVRGDHSYLATTEVRKPLFLLPLREGRSVGIGLHAFHDWGKAWVHGAGFNSGDLRHAWGLGAHLNVNAANLRFEWARTDEGEDVYVFEDRFTF